MGDPGLGGGSPVRKPTASQVLGEMMLRWDRAPWDASELIAALAHHGYAIVPRSMTAAMLAASRAAMRDYINRAPPDMRRKLGKRNGVATDVKHQIRFTAAVDAAPRPIE